MRKSVLVILGWIVPLVLAAHVTPNVTLLRRGDFVKESLPAATKFFERAVGSTALAEIHRETGWTPSGDEAKVYIGRDDAARLVGRVVFLWLPSQHGPIGIAVAFAPEGRVLRAAVTDVGTEPLVWVRPLLAGASVVGVEGLARGQTPDAARIAPAADGAMSRYYARVIADGIARAQAVERAASSGDTR